MPFLDRLRLLKKHWGLAIAALAATLYLGKKYFRGGVCRIRKDLTGTVVIITGGNSGIGQETAKALASMNAIVIIASRDEKKTMPIIEKIKKETGNDKIEFMKLDLSDLKGIKEFVKKFKEKYNKLHILINNAGILAPPKRQETKDGYEMQFGVNFLGHFYLTLLLLDLLKASAPSRVVCVCSRGHLGASINWDDIMQEEKYSGLQGYRQSKLAMMMFVKELQRRAEKDNIKSVAVHPGAVRTEVTKYLGPVTQVIMKVVYPIGWFFSKSPKEGAQTILQCVLEDQDKLQGGAYYADCKPTKYNENADIVEDCKRLWELSIKMIENKVPEPLL